MLIPSILICMLGKQKVFSMCVHVSVLSKNIAFAFKCRFLASLLKVWNIRDITMPYSVYSSSTKQSMFCSRFCLSIFWKGCTKVSLTDSKMYVPTVFKVWDSSSTYYDLLLLTLTTKPSPSCLLPSVNRELLRKIFCVRCCHPALFNPQNNNVIRCHGIASDARVASQGILVLGAFNHTLSQIYAFLVEALHAKSFLYRCQTWRKSWTRKLSLEGYSILWLLVNCYFSVLL